MPEFWKGHCTLPHKTEKLIQTCIQRYSYRTGLSLRFRVAGYLLLVAGEVASSDGDPPQEVFEVQLLPFSKMHSRPKKAIFIKSTAIISGFMMITSLLKKTTTF